MRESGVAQAGRRGRPTASRAASIDAQILSAALRLFLDAGFSAVSMEAVALAAGVSKGTLYARHPGKRELLRALMNDRISVWSQAAAADDHRLPLDLAGRLHRYAAMIRSAHHLHETRQMRRFMRSVASDIPDLATEWHELTFGSFLRVLAGEIANAAAHDGLPPTDGTFLAELFLYALSGWSEAEELSPKTGEAEYQAFVENLIAVALLAARAGGSPAAPNT